MLTHTDFVFSLKSQLADQEGMGGKLGEDDKKTILAAIKEKSDWLDEHSDATAEDYEEQLAEIQGVVGPISARMYGAAGGDDEPAYSHDEL